jgi:bifunctional N-acetylglucosamine-1-phosphate-uridyltransferase/glucosamine-1-phosphate-acetyltransferase GlmU-like protein
MMAFSRTDADNRISEVKEKSCYTSNHFQEHASAGLYYFKKGSYVMNYFEKAIHYNINYNGEYYVTLVYNLMIRDGLDVFSYPVDTVLAFGTPSEVENFEAWQIILKGGQIKSVKDLIDCYTYWGRYVKNKPQR